MNLNIVKKAKIFLIAALVLLVAGMAVFGIFGMNQPIDNKLSYEMQINIDQTAEDAIMAMQESVVDCFEDEKISPVSYSSQKLNDGAMVIYKFDENVVTKVNAVKTSVEKALEKAEIANVGVTVVVQEVHGSNQSQIGWIALALGIAAVVIFLYVLIIEKLAAALATLFSSVLALMLFIAVTSLARVPVGTSISVGAAVAAVLAATLSVATVNRYKEEFKNSDGKASFDEITDKVAMSELVRYITVLASVIIGAVLLGVLCWIYVGFMAIQLAVAGIVATCSAYFATPIMWSIIKGIKRK